MKIAFYHGDFNKNSASQIINLLKEGAPHHHYEHYQQSSSPDLWHCLAPCASLRFIPKASRSIVALSDMRFITHPEIFSLTERLFRFPLYRYHCRHAARLIAPNGQAKRRVVEQLGIDESNVVVCNSSHLYRVRRTPSREEMLSLRAKLELPDNYLLVVGDIDTMHGHTTILHSILALPQQLNVVILGRRTTHSDVLLQAVCDVGASNRVLFIYELSEVDIAPLYRMAMVMLYFPTFESRTAPIIEALDQHVPMILSDTPLNREVAATAAIYVTPYDEVALTAALKVVIYNESYRGQLIAQCWAESRRHTREAVVEQLMEIYETS